MKKAYDEYHGKVNVLMISSEKDVDTNEKMAFCKTNYGGYPSIPISRLEFEPKFEVGDIVEWGDFIGKVLFVTPTMEKPDEEYRYVLRLIRDKSGKDISGSRYVFVLEGVLENYDYKSD